MYLEKKVRSIRVPMLIHGRLKRMETKFILNRAACE